MPAPAACSPEFNSENLSTPSLEQTIRRERTQKPLSIGHTHHSSSPRSDTGFVALTRKHPTLHDMISDTSPEHPSRFGR